MFSQALCIILYSGCWRTLRMEFLLATDLHFRRHHWQAISSVTINVTVPRSVCLSVCLSRSHGHCAQMTEDIDTIFLAYDITVPCLFSLAHIGLGSTHFYPNFALKVTPVDLSVGDIRRQIAAEWLEIAQWSQWTAYRKLSSLFRIVPLLTPMISLPKNTGPITPMRAISPFAKLLCPFKFIFSSLDIFCF